MSMTEPENLAVITLKKVFSDGLCVCLVTHDQDDGGWQFLTFEPFGMEDAIVVGLGEMLAHDPSLNVLMDLPVGWKAVRKNVHSAWERKPNLKLDG